MSVRRPKYDNRGRIVVPKKAKVESMVIDDMRRQLSSTNQQAMRVGGWANPSKGGETKFIDTNVTTAIAFNSSAFGAGTLLNGCANGSDASTRIGRKITLKSLLLRYTFRTGTSSTWGCKVRILVVYDKQANSAAPAITDILLADEFNSPNNLSNRDRFVTIFDQITDSFGAGTGEIASASDVLYKKLNFETMFNSGSAGTIGDITSGSIYVFTAQNGGLLAANASQNTRVRVRFTDV